MSAFDAFSDELDAFLDADGPATLAADELSALEAVEAGLDDDAEGGVRGGARRWKGAGGGRDAAALSKTEREERAAQEALESLRGVASGMQRSVQGLGPAGGPAAAGAPSTRDVRALAHDLLAELGAPQPAAATAGHAAVVGGGQGDALPPGAQRAVLTPAPSTAAPTNATTTTAAGAPSAALEDARAAMAAMTLAATVNTPGTGTTPADAEATAALRATLTPGPAAAASPASAAATNPVAARPAADTATQPAAPSESSGSDDAQLDALLAGLGAPLPGSAPRPPAATATASTVSSSSSSSGSSGSGAPPVTSAELDELLAQL